MFPLLIFLKDWVSTGLGIRKTDLCFGSAFYNRSLYVFDVHVLICEIKLLKLIVSEIGPLKLIALDRIQSLW